jgi:cytidyltransferase-like protein
MIISVSDLPNLRKEHKSSRIVLASGVFDLLHVGHVNYLESLKNYGDISVVLVKPDARVKRHKHSSRPVIPEADRARMVDAIKGVDYVVIGSDIFNKPGKVDAMYEEVFDALKPDTYVTTNDNWGKLAQVTSADIQILPRRKVGHFDSTTSILEHIRTLESS